MIPVPQGWAIADTNRGVLLVHPQGPDAAAIRYRERAGRPRRLGALVDDVVTSLPGVTRHDIGPVERFVTDDGELAALVSIRAHDASGVLYICAAYVITDDFYSAAVGYTREHGVEVRQLVRELAQRDNHALGVRRRRFEYTPPEGWQPLPRGLSTAWIPPDYPNRDTRVLVYPANPMSVVGRADVEGMYVQLEDAGWTVLDAITRPTSSRNGLAIESNDVLCRRGAVTRMYRTVVAFDSLYQYPFELCTTRTDEDHAVLDAMVDSIKPLASPITSTPALVGYWVD